MTSVSSQYRAGGFNCQIDVVVKFQNVCMSVHGRLMAYRPIVCIIIR